MTRLHRLALLRGAALLFILCPTAPALAVLARGTYIFALPGSNGAVEDGWDKILAEQLDSRNRPCNFVELMPRLREK